MWKFCEFKNPLDFSLGCGKLKEKERKGFTMAKRIYKLEFTDFIGRKCERTIPAKDIISAMDWAKGFIRVNGYVVGWVVSTKGKRYIV